MMSDVDVVLMVMRRRACNQPSLLTHDKPAGAVTFRVLALRTCLAFWYRGLGGPPSNFSCAAIPLITQHVYARGTSTICPCLDSWIFQIRTPRKVGSAVGDGLGTGMERRFITDTLVCVCVCVLPFPPSMSKVNSSYRICTAVCSFPFVFLQSFDLGIIGRVKRYLQEGRELPYSRLGWLS